MRATPAEMAERIAALEERFGVEETERTERILFWRAARSIPCGCDELLAELERAAAPLHLAQPSPFAPDEARARAWLRGNR